MRHLLSINDLSKTEILDIFEMATRLKKSGPEDLLDGSTLSLFFEKPSTRTRLSFEAAMFYLKGNSVYLDAHTMQVSRGETYEDTAKTLSLYSDFIAARLYRHEDLARMAGASGVPVINALTDLEHPCQALSDLYTIRDAKGLEKTRIAFIGDIATNTANSLLLGAAKLGAEMALVGPKGVSPNNDYLRTARRQARVEVFEDIKKGFEGADVVYTDTWVSMGQEAEAAKRKKLFGPYQLNAKALGYAKKDAVVMHCLPAHRGEEITADVLDGKRSIVWEQAKNKMFIEAAILVYLCEKQNKK